MVPGREGEGSKASQIGYKTIMSCTQAKSTGRDTSKLARNAAGDPGGGGSPRLELFSSECARVCSCDDERVRDAVPDIVVSVNAMYSAASAITYGGYSSGTSVRYESLMMNLPLADQPL